MLSQKTQQEIVVMYRKGVSIAAICSEMHITPPTIYRVLLLAEEPLRGKASVKHQEVMFKADRQLLIDGKCFVSIADAIEYCYSVLAMKSIEISRQSRTLFGTHVRYDYVREVLASKHLALIPGVMRTNWRKVRSQVIRDIKKGMPINEICEAYGIQKPYLALLLSNDSRTASPNDQETLSNIGALVEEITANIMRRLTEEGAVNQETVQLELPLMFEVPRVRTPTEDRLLHTP